MITNGEVLIRVEGLRKSFGDFYALDGINEEIRKGEVVVIVGPSGSGKSTLSAVLVGNPLYEVTSGTLTQNGNRSEFSDNVTVTAKFR